MSPILLKIFVDIIDGTYDVQSDILFKLKVKESQIEYDFIVVADVNKEEDVEMPEDGEDWAEEASSEKSPLTTLQDL